jgi:preprotein translocase subunit SecG
MGKLNNLAHSWHRLRSDRRGFLQQILLVGVAVMVLIAVILAVAYFTDALPNVADPVANATITETISVGYNALTILGIAILISAVVTIIVVLMQSFGFGFGGGVGRR